MTATSAATCWRAAIYGLNSPRRPLEACGTSGMKAVFNRDAELLDVGRLVGRSL